MYTRNERGECGGRESDSSVTNMVSLQRLELTAPDTHGTFRTVLPLVLSFQVPCLSANLSEVIYILGRGYSCGNTVVQAKTKLMATTYTISTEKTT